jgi:hypothetical protein
MNSAPRSRRIDRAALEAGAQRLREHPAPVPAAEEHDVATTPADRRRTRQRQAAAAQRP